MHGMAFLFAFQLFCVDKQLCLIYDGELVEDVEKLDGLLGEGALGTVDDRDRCMVGSNDAVIVVYDLTFDGIGAFGEV